MLCPRGARPGDVLGAIRAYAYRALAWPTALANLCSSVKNLPVLIGIPAVTIFIMWLISGGMHIPSGEQFARVGYTQFFGHWDFRLLAKNVLFIDIIMLTAVGIAVTSVYKGVSTLWKGMSESIGLKDVPYRPSVPQFIKLFLWPSIIEILQHKRFKECTVNADRVKGHQPMVFGFHRPLHCHLLLAVHPRCHWYFYPIDARSDFHVEPGQIAGQRFCGGHDRRYRYSLDE